MSVARRRRQSLAIADARGEPTGRRPAGDALPINPATLKARGSGYASWRSAVFWGRVSGVGFGVSEGVNYCGYCGYCGGHCGGHYNGVLGGRVYRVRFVSCVALHAIRTAAVGVGPRWRGPALLHAEGRRYTAPLPRRRRPARWHQQ